MKMSKCKRVILKGMMSLLLIAGMVLGFEQPVYASKILRVGFFEFDGYHNLDENGCRSGYGYEFIQQMLRYNNYTAEYIGYDKNWSQMQEMLENGEIDILTSAQKTPEREEKFDFSEAIGTSAAILTVRAGNNTFSAGEYNTYSGMRVGVIEGNSRNDAFEAFAQEKGFNYSLVYYDAMSELTDALEAGKIDAIVTSNLRQLGNEWVLDKFAASPFYAMVKKGNTQLLEQINYAIDQMNTNSIGWQDELFGKYYAGSNGSSIALSSTERAYLQMIQSQGRKIRVIVNPDRDPYSYVENGEVKGILPEIFAEIATRVDLPYEYVTCSTRQEYQELVSSGVVDVVLDGRYDLSAAEDNGYKLTDPYMELSYAAVERSEFSGEVKSVAVLKLSDTSESNMQYFTQGRQVEYFDTTAECVKAVENDEVDACYLYDYSGQKVAIENIAGVLQSTTQPSLQDSLSIGVLAAGDYRLLAILNKGVHSVKADFVDTAIKHNTDFSIGNLTLLQLMRRNPEIPTIIVALIALLLILFGYGYQKKINEEKEQQRNKELERFIGYVCKSNTTVMEVNFATGMAREYVLNGDHIEYKDSKYAYTDAEAIHRDIPDEDFEEIDNTVNTGNINELIDQVQDRYFEYRIRENGEYRWYAVTMAAIPRDPEHPKNVIIFKRDIDEMKKKEEETKQSLKDALTAANQASESKGNFLSNMSHEIRTPLNAIIGYLSLAKDPEIEKEKQNHYLDNCDVASRHLLQIINDILDMSSIESGKLKIAQEEFDLKKEISDITTIFFQNAKNKGVNFETHIEALTQEWVIGDQLRLNQVLMNLLSNAVKFTPEQGLVTLTIKQLSEDGEKVYVRFLVKDSGIGMSEEYMSRIFKPFEQENAGTARKFGGSGLGLSITNNLVQMMGGTIDVSSKVDQGTTFAVTMYFGKSDRHAELAMNADYSHVRALVVDDKEDQCTYVKEMLKRCGVKSDYVTSGNAALRRIKSRIGGDYAYDLCIIDWNMPEMDGGEVTRRIREELGAEMPIIIATAYDVTEFEAAAKAAGANRIIAKPLFQSTLFDILVTTFGQYDPERGKEEQQQIDMSGVHLLLAEDNPMNMDIAVTMLEKAGIKVDQAVNGKEACERFLTAEKGTYDLILMDVQMPVMDGYEATRTIRNADHPEAKTIPIIAMTANAFAEDVTEALANGMDAHIAKPINYDKLFALLQKWKR